MSPNPREKKSIIFRILLHIPVPWVFVLAYLVGVGIHLVLPLTVQSPGISFLIKMAGGILFVIGAVFAAWSLIIFRRARTTTTPGEQSVTLVTTGPYRISRNPMYVSLLLCYLGEAGLLVQAWPLAILPLVLAYIHYIVIPIEEEVLLSDYPEAYQDYCRAVKRWI